MYYPVETQPISSEKFELPFEGKLDPNNRWVLMSELIPWSEFEEEYSSKLSSEMGAPAKTFRMALGSLIIKEKLGISEARNSRTNQGKSLFTILYWLIKI